MSTLRPSYPRGPWRYTDMHQLVVMYETTAEAVRKVVPRPLEPEEGNRVTIEWRRMSEVTGFGPYTEVGHSVACTLDGKPVIYVFQAFLDSESPTLAGREILGFPKRHGEPDLKIVREVLNGTLTRKAIVMAFIEAGAGVVLCDLNAKALEEASRELGERAIGCVTDVSDEKQVEAAMRAARDTFESLDIVVNCAGFGAITPLTELTAETRKAVQAVTLGGVFYGVKHGARLMLEQGRPGVIINISSVNARQPGEGQVAYCAAKAGVDMITRCGALELGGRGIRVVGIAPGLVETPLTKKELENPAMRSLFMGVIPMNRPVAAEEIAAAAVFLASDHSRSINGETIAIDAGSLTRGYPALLTGLKKAS